MEGLHNIAMGAVLLGGAALFYLSYIWYVQNNILMSIGMGIMGLIALANFHLHLRTMKRR